MDSQIDLFHEIPEGILRKSVARQELSSRHDNSLIIQSLLLLFRYYFEHRSSTRVALPSIYVGVFTIQVRRRDIPAGARQASGLTQILRQLRPQVFTVTRGFPLVGK